ncbi:MAG: hypothetical protein ABS44_09615 [Chryseobacterium sp. SCN 40-13]|nr:MAG: hypothetical protein ABS44_09615 [Chryseobacterium sp. SCN 40-13]
MFFLRKISFSFSPLFGYGSGLLRIVFGKMGVLPKVYRTRPEQHPNKTIILNQHAYFTTGQYPDSYRTSSDSNREKDVNPLYKLVYVDLRAYVCTSNQ